MREKCAPREDAGDGQDAAATTPSASLAPGGAWGAAGELSIADLIADKARSGTFFWSVELLPGTTPHLRAQLETSLQQLARRPPAFVSITWHVGHLRDDKHPALELGARVRAALGVPVLLHIAAGRMTCSQVRRVLEACLAVGITNIFALRGDDETDEGSDFHHASDLVYFIRENYGSQFCVGVAGYPSMHPESTSLEEDIFYLKQKVEAGAEFIVTQMVNTFEELHTFVHKCHEHDVKVPIIPGLFLIQSYNTLEKVAKTCSIKVPQNIMQELRQLHNIENQIEYGKNLLKSLLRQMMMFSHCPGAHLFTINKVTEAVAIFSDIGL